MFVCPDPQICRIKLCSHASLLQPKRVADPIGSEEHNNYLKGLAFAKVAFPPDTVKHLAGGTLDREDGIMDEHFQLSGKLKHMSKLLKRFANSNDGSKVLIFSYSTQTLDLIQNYMRGKYEFRRMVSESTPGSCYIQLLLWGFRALLILSCFCTAATKGRNNRCY